MNYKLVADSSCNIISMENPHFASVPMKVRAEKEYIDDASLNLAQMVEELKNRGSHALLLEVRASNAPAIALYEKLGFLQVGCRKNYYHNPREDALILRKDF